MPDPIELPALADDDLRLRRPETADVPEIARICSDPDIQRFTRVPSPYTRDDARAFVDLASRELRDGAGVHLLVVDVADDRILGAVGLSLDHADRVGEVGYWVAPEARGRGVASRAARLLCRYAFEQLLVGHVGLHAAATNPGSNAVARRLGFTHEGTLRRGMIDGPSGDPTAPRCDAIVWGLLPGELC